MPLWCWKSSMYVVHLIRQRSTYVRVAFVYIQHEQDLFSMLLASIWGRFNESVSAVIKTLKAQPQFVEPQFVEPQFVELGLTTFRRTPVRRTFLTSNFYNIEPHFIDFLQHRPPIFSSNSSLFQSVKLFFFVELFFRQTFYFRPLFEG
jgi:hypothetical protein